MRPILISLAHTRNSGQRIFRALLLWTTFITNQGQQAGVTMLFQSGT